jgi:hypothetical protein
MKKIYLLVMLILPFAGIGQTITQADLPAAGDAYTLNVDDTYSGAISAGGTGQTWNYSNLLTNSVDTQAWLAASGTPYASSFPTSNMAMYDWTDTSYSYFTNSSTGFYANGTANPGNNIAYNPPLLYLPVPFSYGSTANSSSRIQQDDYSTGSHIVVVIHFDNTYEGDATGSLTTPQGTYNVLRIKATSLMYDSLYLDTLGLLLPVYGDVSQTTNFTFVSSGNPVNYIMTLDGDSLGQNATSSSYFSGQVNVSVPTISGKQFRQPYPNPANDIINFDITGRDTELTIYSGSGAIIRKYSGDLTGSIDVATLQSGLYHYVVKNNSGSESGNFVVQH